MATLVRPSQPSWIAGSGSVDNAPALVQRSGEPNKAHYVVAIRASYSNPSTNGKLGIFVGGVLVAETDVHGSATLEWNPAWKVDDGKPVSVELSASGTAGTTGSVILVGYTI